MRHHDGRQIPQLRARLLREGTRAPVHQAQGADPKTGPQDQWRTRVEANARLTRDQRIVGEERIGQRVLDDEDLVGQDGMGAEGDRPGCPHRLDPALRLEPEIVRVEQGDGGDRDREQGGGRAADRVEMWLRLGSKNAQRMQGGEPFGLVRRMSDHTDSAPFKAHPAEGPCASDPTMNAGTIAPTG